MLGLGYCIKPTGKWTFSLPNIELTDVMGENRLPRWRMNTPEHFALMVRVSGRDQRGANVGGQRDGNEDEEEAYEHGGVPPRQEAAQELFHMRAPDFEGFEKRFYSHFDAHHNEQMQAHDNYYMMNRQFTAEQVGMARQDIAELQQDVRGIRTNVDHIYENQQTMMDILN